MDALVAKLCPTLRGLKRTKCLEARCRMFAKKVSVERRSEAKIDSLLPEEVVRSKQMIREFVWSVCGKQKN